MHRQFNQCTLLEMNPTFPQRKLIIVHQASRKITLCRITGSKLENKTSVAKAACYRTFGILTFLPSHQADRYVSAVLFD